MSKRNYPLVEKQIRTLKLLYKFRFATTTLLAEYSGVTRSTLNSNLLILYENELVERHYISTDKLDRKAARYFLTSKGVKQLKSVIELNDGVVRSYYKNKTVSQPFVQHNLDVFRAFLNINKHYPGHFNLLTKAETAQYKQFPELRPDLFLQSKGKTGNYFLYIYEDTQLFVIQKHVKQLIQHQEDGEWGGAYPNILIACPTPRIEYRLSQWLESLLEDFDFYVTSTNALLEGHTKEIWTNPVEPEKLVGL